MGPHPPSESLGLPHGQLIVSYTTGPHCTFNDRGYITFQTDGKFRDNWNNVPDEGFNPETEPLAPIIGSHKADPRD